ncbi:HU family DNA-binding protein [Glycomyces luteolus]|uniref:HU family DNA-binding protein n=1 Tax=Glycomyces luteolus TaxID=2670330 RepID=A0A9X3PD66_9ACTN|nr:HU family DNA-binding protein [Glycomyces luteolus]MDA1361592.1 HU family DNA-binding protein [Glycomyces luteolus]
MNKAEFVERIAARTGDRAAAKEVVDVAIDEIQRAVVKGEKVSFAGFGVFEKRQRAARMARNPRTGEAVKVKKTVVPAFRPGTGFKELVTGKRKAAKSATAKKAAPAKKAAAKKATKKTAAKKTTRAASTATRSTATSRVGAKKTAARKTTAKKASPAKKAVRKTAAKSAAKKTTAKKTMKRGRS